MRRIRNICHVEKSDSPEYILLATVIVIFGNPDILVFVLSFGLFESGESQRVSSIYGDSPDLARIFKYFISYFPLFIWLFSSIFFEVFEVEGDSWRVARTLETR